MNLATSRKTRAEPREQMLRVRNTRIGLKTDPTHRPQDAAAKMPPAGVPPQIRNKTCSDRRRDDVRDGRPALHRQSARNDKNRIGRQRKPDLLYQNQRKHR